MVARGELPKAIAIPITVRPITITIPWTAFIRRTSWGCAGRDLLLISCTSLVVNECLGYFGEGDNALSLAPAIARLMEFEQQSKREEVGALGGLRWPKPERGKDRETGMVPRTSGRGAHEHGRDGAGVGRGWVVPREGAGSPPGGL
jgi:hypothetical protein